MRKFFGVLWETVSEAVELLWSQWFVVVVAGGEIRACIFDVIIRQEPAACFVYFRMDVTQLEGISSSSNNDCLVNP